MRSRTRITAAFSAALILALTGCILLLNPIDKARSGANVEEVLFLPSAGAVKRLSMGHTGLVADIYWTRAVQYFGSHHHEGAMRYDLLYPYLDVTTTLDPQLTVAYEFGSMFLSQPPPDGAGQPEKAIELVERGIKANPTEWKLYYNLGFIYFDRKDYEGARTAFERGSRVPGAHPALAVLAASMAQESGDRETARLLWSKIYESSEDQNVKNNAKGRLAAIQVQEDMAQLEAVVDQFRQKTGRIPSNFEEMVAAGWLRGVPQDPTGTPYKLLPNGIIEAPKEFLLYLK